VQGVFRLPELRRLARAPAFVNLAFVDEWLHARAASMRTADPRIHLGSGEQTARSSPIKPGHDDLRLSV
jgi:hypothetical protein